MLLILFGLISYLYLPFLLGDSAFCFDDFSIWYAPYRLMLDRSLSAGILPLWEPYVGVGYPLISNPAVSALNPLNLLALLMGGGLLGLHRLLIFHLMLGGGFTYLLARHLKLRPEAALMGALAFALSGPLNAYIQENAYHVMAMAWLPASLWLFLRGLEAKARGWVWAAWSGAAMGMMMYGGEPQVWYFNAFTLGAVALTHQRRGRAFLYLGLIIGVALLIAWAQISATLSNLENSARGVSAPVHFRMAFSTHPIHLLSLLFPHPGGALFPENSLWAHGWLDSYRYWVHSLYLGLGTLLFALLAQRNRLSLALWGAILFFAWMALGRFGGLYALADGIIPGMTLFRYPEKWAGAMMLPLALLGADGFDRLLFKGEAWRGLSLLMGALGLLSLALLLGAEQLGPLIAEVPRHHIYKGVERGIMRLEADALHALIILGALALALSLHRIKPKLSLLVLAVCAFDLIRVAQITLLQAPYEIYDEPGPIVEHMLKDAPHARVRRIPRQPFVPLPRDSGAYVMHQARTRMTGGMYSYAGRYRSISIIGPPLNLLEGQILESALKGDDPINGGGLFGVRYYIITDKPPPLWLKEHIASGRVKLRFKLKGFGVILLEDTQALPRVWRAGSWIEENPEKPLKAFKARLKAGHNFLKEPILESAPNFKPGGPGGSARFLKDEPEKIIIETEGDQPGILVLSDSFSPGWRAYINDEERPILRSNYITRAVEVPAGRVQLRFEYQHPGLMQAIFTSLAALLLLILLTIFSRRRLG